MPIGAGKYDDLCTVVRERSKAEGAVVIVLNGEHGSGFAVQGPLSVNLKLPDMLEHVAGEIRRSLAAGKL